MKIIVKDIPSEGLEIDKQITPAEIGLDDTDLICVAPLVIKAKVELIGNTVLAKTQAKGIFSLACARCLEPIQKEIEDEFYFDYPVEKRTDAIDLGEDIRQEIILALPPVVLCKEDCQGLCAGCGVNLNLEKCTCHKVTKTQGHK